MAHFTCVCVREESTGPVLMLVQFLTSVFSSLPRSNPGSLPGDTLNLTSDQDSVDIFDQDFASALVQSHMSKKHRCSTRSLSGFFFWGLVSESERHTKRLQISKYRNASMKKRCDESSLCSYCLGCYRLSACAEKQSNRKPRTMTPRDVFHPQTLLLHPRTGELSLCAKKSSSRLLRRSSGSLDASTTPHLSKVKAR